MLIISNNLTHEELVTLKNSLKRDIVRNKELGLNFFKKDEHLLTKLEKMLER